MLLFYAHHEHGHNGGLCGVLAHRLSRDTLCRRWTARAVRAPGHAIPGATAAVNQVEARGGGREVTKVLSPLRRTQCFQGGGASLSETLRRNAAGHPTAKQRH